MRSDTLHPKRIRGEWNGMILESGEWETEGHDGGHKLRETGKNESNDTSIHIILSPEYYFCAQCQHSLTHYKTSIRVMSNCCYNINTVLMSPNYDDAYWSILKYISISLAQMILFVLYGHSLIRYSCWFYFNNNFIHISYIGTGKVFSRFCLMFAYTYQPLRSSSLSSLMTLIFFPICTHTYTHRNKRK